MVSSRSPGVSVTCSNNSTSADVPISNDLDVNSSSREEPLYPRNDNEPERSKRDLNNERSRWKSESGPPSLSMSIDLHHATSGQHDSGSFSASPDRDNATSCRVKVTGSHEVEERYEGFGSVQGDCEEETESPGGSSSAPSPTGPSSLRNPRSPNSTIGRHSWLRTSLRRTPSGTNRKRLSSNSLASQLYRSSSFNSSGRGSICDTAEDMYSDVSLEDDVLDLNQRTIKIKPVETFNVAYERKLPPMVDKSFSGPTDRGKIPNCKNCPYQNYNPCEYYNQPPPLPRFHYPTANQAPCSCQSSNYPSYYNANEVQKSKGSSWLLIFLFILLIIFIIIIYNFLRGYLFGGNANISGRSNPPFLSHQNPYSVPISIQSRKTRKKDVSQNCPAEFVCYNNNNSKGIIIEPETEELPQTSTPKQSMSPTSSLDRGHKAHVQNTSVETSFTKLPKSEETSSNERRQSSGTQMTDDEKLAFLKKP